MPCAGSIHDPLDRLASLQPFLPDIVASVNYDLWDYVRRAQAGWEKIMSARHIPLLLKEGWTRPQENVAKLHLKGADGVVIPASDNRCLEITTPSAAASVP